MKLKPFLVFFFLLLFLGSGITQTNPKQLKMDATNFFEKGKYPESLNLFLKYQRLKPADEEIKQMVGICYYHTNNVSNARRYLQFVISNEKKIDPLAYYYLAKTYHAELDFSNAIKFYKEYLRQTKQGEKFREGVKDDIRRCATAIRMSSQEEVAVVENMGDKVNTVYDEFAPILSPNYDSKIYFSSARRGASGNKRDEKGFVDDLYGNYRSDMYSSVVVNGEWTATSAFGSLLNSTRNDVILDFSETGSVMYFFKGLNYYSGEILVDSFRKTEQSLFPSAFKGPTIGAEGDRDLFFFKDTILLFSSFRSGGYGGSDLYITVFSNGEWSLPKNLGAQINSAYDERSPFLSKDGRTLYFSSNGTKGIGGLDVFKARYDDNTQSWSTPVNMGVPINSAGEDAFFRLSKDGLKAFFSSSRKDGLGERDVFVAYFKGYQNEQRKELKPVCFHLVPAYKRAQSEGGVVITTPDLPNNSGGIDINQPTFDPEEIQSYEFPPLYFGSDENVLTLNNLKELNRVARLMIQYPQLKLQLNSHFDGSSPAQFDLFFSVKRAEKAAEYLVDNGVKPSNVFVVGSGSNYPIARQLSELNNANGQNFNRRLDLSFSNTEGLPLAIRMQAPRVQSSLKDSRGEYYKKSIAGLSYKVQVAAIRQNYVSDIILNYSDPMVESRMDQDIYRYSVGLYKTFQSAEELKKELLTKGLTDAFIAPYINGKRVNRSDLRLFTQVYPDLVNYLSNTGG